MIPYARKRINKLLQRKLPLVIFFIFFILALTLQSQPYTMVSHADPYYHISHSLAYITGDKMQLPVYSTISSIDGNIYPLYHTLLSPFVYFAQQFGFSPIAGAKLFQSIVVGLVFMVFFLVAKILLDSISPTRSNKNINLALLATILLWSFAFGFVFRLFLIRPEGIILILFLYSIVATLKNHKLMIFMIGFVSPFLYSVSFIFLIIPTIYFFTKKVFYRSSRYLQNYISPLIYTSTGLLIGIILRPDTLHYLYNAYYVSIVTILLTLSSSFQPAEVYSLSYNAITLIWIIPFVIINIFFIYKIIKYDNPLQQIPSNLVTMAIFANIFFVMTIFITRTFFYSIPIIILFGILVYNNFIQENKIMPKLTFISKIKNQEISRIILEFKQKLLFIFKHKYTKIIAVLFLVLYATNTSLYITNAHTPFRDLGSLKIATEVIKENTNVNDLIINIHWSTYPILQYLNNENTYAFGMAPAFTQFYNPNIYEILEKITQEQYTSTTNVFYSYSKMTDAKIIFIDTQSFEGSTMHKKISNNPYFEQLYSSPNKPHFYVYAIVDITE